jgi:hypothetical protein
MTTDTDLYRAEVRRRERNHPLTNGGIGHNLPQEAPRAFAQAIRDAGGLASSEQQSVMEGHHVR